jgi:hypothetical protein
MSARVTLLHVAAAEASTMTGFGYVVVEGDATPIAKGLSEEKQGDLLRGHLQAFVHGLQFLTTQKPSGGRDSVLLVAHHEFLTKGVEEWMPRVHLLTPAAKPNFIFVARYAAATAAQRVTILCDTPVTKELAETIFKFTDMAGFFESMTIRNKIKAFYAEQSRVGDRASSIASDSIDFIIREIVTVLSRIDYVDVMKRRAVAFPRPVMISNI